MLPLLKKNSEKAKASQVPAWHTNFRNYATLPDTKIIRTSFFVNGFVLFLTVGALLAFAFQEYKLYDLRRQSNEWQAKVDASKSASDQAVAKYKRFQVEEKKIDELNAFLKDQKLVFSDFIIQLSRTKPQGLVFSGVEYRDTGVSIRGFVQGMSEQATTAVSLYEKQLKEDVVINKSFGTIAMANISRDVQAGRLVFEVVLTFGKAKK
ncbi:MAG: hypothetical protein IPP19_16190 [Verrucomicrobia bacterium]|nr:hypothetical protein [Verrucomicrobiota bacterium]